MTIDVEVTRGDIAEGQMGSICRCPVARAIERATGRPAIVGSATWGWRGMPSLYPMPRAVSEWIADYDAGLAVNPIAFVLDMPLTPVAAR